jgi:phosphoglycerol transferase MdoB-like AlkP superfamily enzyme
MGTLSISLKLSLPLVLTRHSSISVFRIALIAWPFTFAGLALLPAMARAAGSPSVPLWLGLAIVLFLSRIGCLSFSYVYSTNFCLLLGTLMVPALFNSLLLILVREHTPDPSALGAANGISEFVQIVGISIATAPIRCVPIPHGSLPISFQDIFTRFS